jgi:hypothetical protein
MGIKMSGLDEQLNVNDDDIFHLRTSGGLDKKITAPNLKIGLDVAGRVVGPAVTLTGAVSRGDPIFRLHQKFGTGSDFAFRTIIPGVNILAGPDYGASGFYIGADFYAVCYIDVPTATWEYKLRIYEHNFNQTAFTLRGSGVDIFTASSNYPFFMGGGYLRDVDSNTIEFCIVIAEDSTTYKRIYTYRLNKTTYVVTQVGSFHEMDDYWSASNNSYARTAADGSEELYCFYNIVASNNRFRVYHSNRDGTYTERGTFLQYSESHNFQDCGIPFKVDGKYIFGYSYGAANIIQTGYDPITYAKTEQIKAPILNYFGTNQYPTKTHFNTSPIGYDYSNRTDDYDFTIARTFGNVIGPGLILLIYAASAVATDSEAPYWMQVFKYDAVLDFWQPASNPVSIASLTDNVSQGNIAKVFLLTNGLILIDWVAFSSIDTGAASVQNREAYVMSFQNGFLQLIWRGLIRAPLDGSQARRGISGDLTFDGRYYVAGNTGNADIPFHGLLYMSELLGFADRDYSISESVNPVIKGAITGMSNLIAGVPYGWDVNIGAIKPYYTGGLNVAKAISDSILEVDVPTSKYEWICIDER